jgi:hypothetical protein
LDSRASWANNQDAINASVANMYEEWRPETRMYSSSFLKGKYVYVGEVW